MMKVISVITVNLNGRDGLERTLRSVASQSCCGSIRHIVIDGGSTDGSLDVIYRYRDGIHVSVSERDGGIYNAMNKGLAYADGDYTVFLNSGDWFHSPDVVSRMMPFLDRDIVYGDMLIHRTNGSCFVKRYTEDITPDYFTYEALPHEAAFVRTGLYRQIGFREDYRVLSDSIFFHEAIDIVKASYRHVGEVVTDFCLGGISSDDGLLRKERIMYFGKG